MNNEEKKMSELSHTFFVYSIFHMCSFIVLMPGVTIYEVNSAAFDWYCISKKKESNLLDLIRNAA